MSEGKPLTILEMVGIQDDFASLRDLAKNRHFPNVRKIDVDSISGKNGVTWTPITEILGQ